jgi:hypothetical protein
MIQKDKLKNLFKTNPNKWISLPEILSMGIAQYGARILELRREGMNIENKILEIVDGQKHTAFRYTPPMTGQYQQRLHFAEKRI